MSELHADTLATAERIRVATDSGYAPKATVADDGAIVAVYRDGAGHFGRAGFLVATRSADAGRTWSDPVVVVNTRAMDDRSPALGVAADGTVVCAFRGFGVYGPDGVYLARDRRDPPATHTGLVLSRDGGRTWGEPMVWTDRASWHGMSPYGRILALADGSLEMPIYGPEGAYLLRSRDDGRSWGDVRFVAEDMNETAYCVLPSGEWLLVGRSNAGDGQFSLVRRSADGGGTWSEPEPFLTGRRLPSDLTVLSDGSVLATHGYRDAPFGVRARRSIDGGRTWSATDLVIHDAAKTADCGYPTVVRADGWIVIIFYDAGDAPEWGYDPTGCVLECVRVREKEIIETMRQGDP